MQQFKNISELHEKMTRNVFLNAELLINDGVQDISEYDIQGLMFLYFRKALINTEYRADREKHGKVDCVIFHGSEPRIFYEIKTYFKEHEKLNKKDFDQDINKIRKLLLNNDKSRGYIFIAGRKSKFKQPILKNFSFISKCYEENSRKWQSYALPTGLSVRLRPSQKQIHGRSITITWEIKL